MKTIKYLLIIFSFFFQINLVQSQLWMPDETVFEGRGIQYLSMAMGADRSIHLVWAADLDEDSKPDSLYYCYRKDNRWSIPISYAKDTTDIAGVSITLDQANMPHITWGEKIFDNSDPFGQALYHIQIKNQQWTNSNLIMKPATLASWFRINFDHNIIALPDNSLLAYWYGTEVDNGFVSVKLSYYYKQEWSTYFKPFPDFSPDTDWGFSQYAHIIKTPDSSLHVVFIGNNESYAPYKFHYGINYVRNNYSNKNWEQLEVIKGYYTHSSFIYDSKICVTPDNIRYIVWLEDPDINYFADEVYYSYSRDGINWSQPANIFNDGEIVTDPVIASDMSGTVHIMWRHHVYNQPKPEIRNYYVTATEDTMSQPALIWPDTSNALINLVIDADNREHIIRAETQRDTTRQLQLQHTIKYTWRDLPFTKVKTKEPVYEVRSAEYILVNNYPNPFNDRTTFSLEVEIPAKITVSIFNLNGRLVKNLIQNSLVEKNVLLHWNGKDESGNRVAAGVYYFRLIAVSISDKIQQFNTGKLLLLK